MRTFDIRNVNVIVNGLFLTGFADGTPITASKDEENYSTHVGARGEVSRARNADPMGTITVTLKNTSDSNTQLNRLARGINTFPVQIVDANSLKKQAGGSIGWLEKPADLDWGAEVETIEWTFKIADYDQSVG